MTTYSDAAWAYVNRVDMPYGSLSPVVRERAVAAFDAALASVAMQQYEPPEPERLTDPDDPRIKPGALVSYRTSTNAMGEVTIYHHRVDAITGSCWDADSIRKGVRHSDYRLLAPAPDPDAELLAVLKNALPNLKMPDWERELLDAKTAAETTLDSLRAAGYDVVKRADA